MPKVKLGRKGCSKQVLHRTQDQKEIKGLLCYFVSQPDPAGRQSLKHSFAFDFMGSMVVDVVIWFGTLRPT